jgi:glycosyltransferase involved in cell wall biosynthesis
LKVGKKDWGVRILLLSDSGINVDKGGFSQTLYNVFSFVDPDDLLFITSLQSYKIAPSSAPFDLRDITYNIELIPQQRNRLGGYINKFITRVNYSISQYLPRFRKIRAAIKQFDPDIVITAPNGPEAVFMHYRLLPAFEGKKVLPYFMDDWLYQSHLKWSGGDIHDLVKKLLSENDSWLMISKSLADILQERYDVKPARMLEIHNPVDTKGVPRPLSLTQKNEYNFAYAGALWPMHFDALVVMAKAINTLKAKRKLNLVVYTAEANWNNRKKELGPLNIKYGGYIPYKDIHNKLAEADCLLITSSFSKEWQTHSKGSVQTKITDYLKAGKLIISCGPFYSANHDFLKRYECGICIETNDVQKAAVEIDTVLNDVSSHNKYVTNGFEALKNNFSFEKVHQELKGFLAG